MTTQQPAMTTMRAARQPDQPSHPRPADDNAPVPAPTPAPAPAPEDDEEDGDMATPKRDRDDEAAI